MTAIRPARLEVRPGEAPLIVGLHHAGTDIPPPMAAARAVLQRVIDPCVAFPASTVTAG